MGENPPATDHTVPTAANRLVLRDLPLPSRLVLTLFLASVGFGYLSALTQLHFNGGTSPGELLPTPTDVEHTYHGTPPTSQLERLMTADEHKSFNGSGSMRAAFTGRSSRWDSICNKRCKEKGIDRAQAEKELRAEREVEILAAVDWIRAGASQDDYARHLLPAQLAPLIKDYPQAKFFVQEENGKVFADVKEIINARCARCHYDGGRGAEGQIHLDEFDVVEEYAKTPAAGTSGGMSLAKLAQTTHVHLLGFSMLYGLTGLIFTFTSYPGWLRAVIGPWALIAQLVDISFWWLGRMDPMFAQGIVITGGLAALGLVMQIGLSVFNMFDRKGKFVLLLLIVAAGVGGGYLEQTVIGPFLQAERAKAQ